MKQDVFALKALIEMDVTIFTIKRECTVKAAARYIYLYWQIILNPTRHIATNPQPQYVCEEGPPENKILKCIDSTPCVWLKNSYMAKSITLVN